MNGVGMIRQGDVVLLRLSKLPSQAQRRQETVATIPGENGHTHALVGAELFEATGSALAVVPNGSMANLGHDEHPAVDVGPGVWEIRTPQAWEWPRVERPKPQSVPVEAQRAQPRESRLGRVTRYID